MEVKSNNIPTKVEEKLSFLDLMRKILKRTTKSVDKNGKVKYISYPPKKGFTEKQKRNLEELEINDVSIVGETRDMSLEELKGLKKLTLGRGVIAISENTLPNLNLEILKLSDTVKQIPPNVIKSSTIKKVQGKDFCIASKSGATNTDIYIDTDNRLHFIESGRFSSSQVDDMELHGVNIDNAVADAPLSMTRSILEASSDFENKSTIYVFDNGKQGSRSYGVHAVLDEYPMPQNRTKTFSEDKLIGIFISGKEKVDLENLVKYPNLEHIYIGKDVKKVTGVESLEDTNIENINKVKQKIQYSVSGKKQTVNMLSENTLLLNKLKEFNAKQDIPKILQKEDEISLDD